MIQTIPIGDKRMITPGAVRNVHVNTDESSMVYFVGASCMPLKPVDGPDFCKSLLGNPIFVGCDFPDRTHRIIHLSFVSQVNMNDAGETRIFFTDGSTLPFLKATESRIIFESIERRMEMFNRAWAMEQAQNGQPAPKRTESGIIIP